MDRLQRIRKAQLAQVKGELEAAEKLTERKASVGEAADRLEQLKELAGKFRKTQESIEQEQESAEDDDTKHNVREAFNMAYYAARDLLEKYISVNNPDEVGSSATGSTAVDVNCDLREAMRLLLCTQRAILENQRAVAGLVDPAGDHATNVRLPPINVPMFNGERKNWGSFKDIYVTTIHNRTDLKDSVKMQYLISFLDGYAKQLVSSYSISDAHYQDAWNVLKNYYDKKKFTVFSLVQEFVDQPTVVTASSDELRKLATTSDEVVRQLNTLGDEFNKRDPWLIHLLLEKVDDETRLLWAQQITEVETPSLDDFLKFLDNRCDALETCTAFSKKAATHSKTEAVNRKMQSLHVAIEAETCAICFKEHSIYRCEEFKKLDVRCRRDRVARAKLCYNCLRSSHTVQACRSKTVCRNTSCMQRHHSLLCHNGKSEEHSVGVNNPGSQPSTGEPALTTLGIRESAEVQRKACMLPTAVVRIRKCDGNFLEVRALIDSGSEASLVSERCFNKLGLPRSHDKIEVTGIGRQAAGTANGLVQLEIANRFTNAEVLQTSAYVVPNLTSSLPKKPCEVHSGLLKNKKVKRSLADPAYQLPGPIDLILGADVFLALLQPGQVQDSDGIPVAQNTVLGWITSGYHTVYTQGIRINTNEGSTGLRTRF